MRIVELASFDITAMRKVAKILKVRLTELGANVKIVEPGDCILNQAIRLIKTYASIPIDRNTMLYLDAAREHQNTVENVQPHKGEDILIIKLGSFTFDNISRFNNVEFKRKVTKYIIPRIHGFTPELILYLLPDMQEFIKRRIKTNNKYRVEFNLKGAAAKSIAKRVPKVLDFIKKRFKINTGIINMGEAAEGSACDAIVEILIQEGIITRR